MKGDIVIGSSSSLTLSLVNSSIKGKINANNITLTGNSYYTSLTNEDSENSNIISGSYSLTFYNESSSTSSSNSTNSSSSPSSSSSGGSPPDKPGSDQSEPE